MTSPSHHRIAGQGSIVTGLPTTEIMDRAYFHGIYLHDPDGHIVEIATGTPGITADESEAELGRTVQFPPGSDIGGARFSEV